MKRFYFQFLLCGFVLLFCSSAQAQYTTTYVSYPAGGNWSNNLTWITGTAPPSPCDNCEIIILGPVVMDAPDPFEFTNGAGRNKIIISAGTSLTVNSFVMGLDLDIVVSDPATLDVENEMQLNSSSTIQLNGAGSILTAGLNLNPSTGSLYPGDPAGDGIYFSRDGAIPMDLSTSYFDVVVSAQGQYTMNAGAITNFYPEVTINCNGNNGSSTPCATGVVFGPGDVENSGAPDLFQFVHITPLPVTLVKFIASPANGKSVNLSWSTAQEINSDYFLVERSADGASWEPLGQVAAKGNSSGIVEYKYVDPAPANAVNYYRLKMVDLDSKFKYSRVAKVVLDGKSASLTIYNNPFHDMVRIKVNLHSAEVLDLKLTDMQGRTFIQQTVKTQSGDNFININPAFGAKGLYILTIKGQTYNQSVKLVRE